MSFLYPSFLWALSALAIPILVHFFQFRRTKKVVFTRVALLRQLEAQSQSFRSIKQWILLILRLLLMACLILAFAQPQWRGASQAVGVTSIWVDNSRSLEIQQSSTSLLDLIAVELDQALSKSGDRPRFQFWTHETQISVADVHPASYVQEKLTSLQYASASQPLQNIWQKQQLAAQMSGLTGPTTYIWFSDFQKSTTSGPWGELKENETLHLFPLQGSKPRNVWIDSVWLMRPFVQVQAANQLRVRIRQEGQEPITQMPLRLFLNNRSTATVPVDIPANGYQDVSISFSVRSPGNQVGLLRIEDPQVVFDNDFHFLVEVSPRLEVLHLKGAGVISPYVPAVFGDDSLFSYRQTPITSMDPGQIGRFPLIVLEGVEKVSSAVLGSIREAMQRGSTLIWIPKETGLDKEVNQALFSGLLTETNPHLLPLEEPDVKSSFFQDVIESRGGGKGQWAVPKVQVQWQWKAPTETLVRLRDASPVLQRKKGRGKGALYVWNTALLQDRLGEHALFPAIMLKIALESVAQKPLAFRMDQPAPSVSLPSVSGQPSLSMVGPSGTFIPNQSWNGFNWTFQWPSSEELPLGKSLQSGLYTLQDGQKSVGQVAINAGRKESYLEAIPEAELAKQMKGKGKVVVHSKVSLGDLLADASNGKSLWWYFVLMALVLAIAEGILGRYWRQKG
ncbi:MAG: BatA domain-containing protein [Spirosomataceae bacterium]